MGQERDDLPPAIHWRDTGVAKSIVTWREGFFRNYTMWLSTFVFLQKGPKFCVGSRPF